MTVASETNLITAIANGSQTVFPYTFRALSSADLVVIGEATSGVETYYTESTDYTVSGIGSYSGGNVTFVAAPANGTRITVRRAISAFTQNTDLRNQGAFFAETHEDVFDRLVMMLQTLKTDSQRSMRARVSDFAAGVSTDLPNAAGAQLLGWTADGTALTNYSAAELNASTFSTEKQVATAAQTVFNMLSLVYTPGTNNLAVYRNGLRLILGEDYTETTSTRVTLTAGATASDELLFVGARELNDAIGAESVSFLQSGIGAVARSIQSKARESVSVLDFGAVGDGVTNDQPAIQAAIDSLGAAGGSVSLGAAGKFLIDGNLTIKPSVSLVGPHQITGSPGNNASAPYGSMGGVLILNSSRTITLNSGASLNGVLVYRSGMTFPAADATAFAGTAITVAGDDASLKGCMILGFAKAVLLDGFQRLRAKDLNIDCSAGIEITNCYDVPRLESIQCWPFATIAASGTNVRHHRSGSAFYIHDNADGTNLSNCFSYGYLNGFYFKNCAISNATNCVADNTTLYPTSAGWRFEGNINGFNCSSAASYSCGNGIIVNTVSTQFVPIHNFFIAGHTYNAIEITLGHADIAYNYITTTPAAVSVAASSSVVRFDFNTLVSVANFVYGAVSTVNIKIGANNFAIDNTTASFAAGTNIVSPGVAAADPLPIPNLGDCFNVIGTTGFGGLAGGWAGRKITLLFAGSLTVFNGTGTAANMRLSGGANFSAVAGSTLTLQHNGTQWFETGRSA